MLKLWLACALASASAAQPVVIELRGLRGKERPMVFAVDNARKFTEADPVGDTPAEFRIPNLWSCDGGEARGPRLFVLAPDNAGTYLEPSAICGKARLQIELKRPEVLKLAVWPRLPELRQTFLDDLRNANWIFRRNNAGVQFEAEFPSFTKEDTVGLSTHGRCEEVLIRKPLMFSDGSINVYPGWGPNNTCPAVANHRRDIVFIQEIPVLGDTAHELGHVLGLNQDDEDTDTFYPTGHTPPKPKVRNGPAPQHPFTGVNTMWAGSLLLDHSFTLGQVFWMNFSCGSVLAQERQARGGLKCIVCPGGCPTFRTQHSGAKPDGTRKFAVAPARGCLSTSEDCPKSMQQRLFSLLDFFQSDVDRAFEIISRNDGVPRYCTKSELAERLRERYSAICPNPRDCVPEGTFVDRWQRNTALAGAIRVSAIQSQQAWEARENKGCETDAYCKDRYRQLYGAATDFVARGGFKNLQRKRIVCLLDPDANRAELLLLHTIGFKVDCAGSDDEAMSMLRSSSARRDSMLLVNFGKTETGSRALELASRFRGTGIPVIVYSESVMTGQVEELKKAGAFGETADPFNLTNLILCAAGGKCEAPSQPLQPNPGIRPALERDSPEGGQPPPPAPRE